MRLDTALDTTFTRLDGWVRGVSRPVDGLLTWQNGVEHATTNKAGGGQTLRTAFDATMDRLGKFYS